MDCPTDVTPGSVNVPATSGASTPKLGLVALTVTPNWFVTCTLNVAWRKAWVYACEPITSKPPLGSGIMETGPADEGWPVSLVPSPQLTVAEVKSNNCS